MNYKMEIRSNKFHNEIDVIKYKIRVKRGVWITGKLKIKLANI